MSSVGSRTSIDLNVPYSPWGNSMHPTGAVSRVADSLCCPSKVARANYVYPEMPRSRSMSATKQPLPRVYHHKLKDKPGFQRQNAKTVRRRSRATYHADPEKAKAINAEWAKKNPEARREAVRKSRAKNLRRTLKRERASYRKRRTPELLAARAAYSRAWRLRMKLKGALSQTCTPQCIDHNRGQ